jgi:glycosyltransferase involved in cell wall biosynthesis
MAKTYFLTTPGNLNHNSTRFTNLLQFIPDGDINVASYYYAARSERSARLARGLFRAVCDFIRERGRPDLIVCHSSWGPPQFIIRELDIPVVTYLEFPSYFLHGWDPNFPPDLSQRLTDCNMEMISFYHVLTSAMTIVPSSYAKSLLPAPLQAMVEVQYEGFDFPEHESDVKIKNNSSVQGFPLTIGFAARDLSAAKGFHVFIRLVDRLIREGDGDQIRFVAIGDPSAITYGYEQQFVKRFFGASDKTFLDYLLTQYPAAKAIDFRGKLPYSDFVDALNQIDFFLYPLQFGVGNWGLMEILARSKAVIASNRCFVPEIITNGVNGILVDGDDAEWLFHIRHLRDHPEIRESLAAAAVKLSCDHHISQVAPRYMNLFEAAINRGNRCWA